MKLHAMDSERLIASAPCGQPSETNVRTALKVLFDQVADYIRELDEPEVYKRRLIRGLRAYQDGRLTISDTGNWVHDTFISYELPGISFVWQLSD